MRRPLWFPIALFLCLGVSPLTPAQSASGGRPAPSDAEPVFRELLTRFYDACHRKDLAAVEALWHPQGPARSARNLLELDFERRTIALVSLQLKQAGRDAGGGRALAVVDLDVVEAPGGPARRERRVREFTFLEDGAVWKIWNEGRHAGSQLAARLLKAAPAERAALLASDPEMRSDDALAGLARELTERRSRGLNNETLDALQLQVELARILDNRPLLARGLLDAGLVYQVMGQLEPAGRAFAEARDLYAAIGTPAEVAALDSNIASVAYVQGDYAKAAERYRMALGVFDAARDEAHSANTLHSLGNALFMLGDFEGAVASYDRCLSLNEKTSNRYGISAVLLAMGALHKELGDYAAAIDAYSRSAVSSGANADHVNAARAEDGVGDIHRLVGDYASALQHYTASLAHWERTPDAPSRASSLFAVGQVYALQRSFRRAIDVYQQALALDEKAGESGGVARDLGGLGGAYFGMGQLDIALEHYKKSLLLREQLKDLRGAMWTLAHMGVLHTAAGRHADALEAYQRALATAQSQGEAGAVCTILALRGANELAREDPETALQTSANAATMAERLELFDALAFARTTTGKALGRTGRRPEARAALNEAIAALERVPTAPGTETFFDDRRAPYLALIERLVADGEHAAAFRVSEQSRTRALARAFGGDGSLIVSGLTGEEREQESQLLRTTRALAVKVRREQAREHPDPTRLATLREDLSRTQSEAGAFRETLFTRHTRLRLLRAQAEPAAAADVANVLRPSEALLSFAVSEKRTYVFVAKAGAPDGIAKVATIDKSASELATQAAAWREALASRRPTARELSRQLHDVLVSPVSDAIAASRALVIVPDAFLWWLPFEALADGPERSLVRRHSIGYASSLTALAAMRAESEGRHSVPASPRGGQRSTLVAAGDALLTPASRSRLDLTAPGLEHGAPAARELRSLGTLFGTAAPRAFVRDRARADRVAAAAEAAGGRAVLHLAVPGRLSDASPLHSLIALPLGGGDDLLEAADVLGLSLPADIVVLPRVEPGGMTTGEAASVLAWALFVAGSPTTVVSRWLPSQAPARTGVAAFYRAWLAGASADGGGRAARAVQKAAVSVMAGPDTEPADWAWLMTIGR